MPPPFAFNNAVLAETYKRIVENTKCITCRVWETGATAAVMTARITEPTTLSQFWDWVDHFFGDSVRCSDSHDSDFAARSPGEPFYVVRVAGENRGLLPKGCRHRKDVNHNGVNHIRRLGQAQQGPCFVRLGIAER